LRAGINPAPTFHTIDPKLLKTTIPIGALEIKFEIKKDDSINHMDSGIFDEPECMGKRRGRV
jgi:hypothetical protein